jgi:hypothetical protein
MESERNDLVSLFPNVASQIRNTLASLHLAAAQLVPASARERDYHRQKYLESRGWKIKRIWSMDWWRDPQREIYNICSLVDTL